MKRSSILAATAIFGGLIVVGGGLAMYKANEIRASANGPSYEPVEAVRIVEARETSWQPTADLVGTVFAVRSVNVRNERAGVVTSVGFDSGAIVEKGQVILTQDDTVDRADLEAAQASVRVAEANVLEAESRIELAQQMLDRFNAVEARAIAATERDRAESELETAQAERIRWQAEVDLARAQVAQVEARLQKLTIVAPFRARAGMRLVHEGQYLAEGAEVVALQEITDEIYLDFAIPQEFAPRVQIGTAVMATGELLGPDPVRIEVIAVDALVNDATRHLRVRSIVDNRDGRLSPGMFVRIRVPAEAPRTYVMAPGAAVRRASYADSVFVVTTGEDGSSRVSQRFVKLGAAVGDEVIVLDGLRPGERVAASGAFKLRDGVMVREADAPMASPAETGGDSGQRKSHAAL